jgi:methylase of polypeptide subunit release factors
MVLDMGTGPGVLAILAAMHGAHVIATDISVDAIECTKLNVCMNNIRHRVSVRMGDLFESINNTERFDLVVFNPPFMDGNAARGIEFAIYDHNCSTLEKFLRQVPEYLSPSGRILVAFSNVGPVDRFVKLIKSRSFRCSVKAHAGNVLRFYVVELVPS